MAFYDERLNFIVDASLKTSEIGSMFGAVLCAAKLVGKRTDLIVGAPTYATKSTYNLGAVYVYLALRIDVSNKSMININLIYNIIIYNISWDNLHMTI